MTTRPLGGSFGGTGAAPPGGITRRASLAFAAILGLSIGAGVTAAGVYLGASLRESRKPQRIVTVRGLAEREVDADLAVWPRGPRHGAAAPPSPAPFRKTLMEAAKATVFQPREGGLQTVRMITETLRIVTDKRCELYDLTERIADVLRRHDVKDGMVLLSSLHTTFALFVNEWQSALLHDVKSMLSKVVSPGDGWRHDDPEHSDCDRRNAHSHLQATLLGHALSLGVAKGKLVLGQFQAVIAAELDGPRSRDLAIQIIAT